MPAFSKFRMVFALSCWLLYGCSPAKQNPKGVAEGLVRAVPLQSTSAEVLDYLNTHKIEHSQYARDPLKGNLIQAGIHYDPSGWKVVETGYGIDFRFDDHNRLIAKDIHEHLTGP